MGNRPAETREAKGEEGEEDLADRAGLPLIIHSCLPWKGRGGLKALHNQLLTRAERP